MKCADVVVSGSNNNKTDNNYNNSINIQKIINSAAFIANGSTPNFKNVQANKATRKFSEACNYFIRKSFNFNFTIFNQERTS